MSHGGVFNIFLNWFALGGCGHHQLEEVALPHTAYSWLQMKFLISLSALSMQLELMLTVHDGVLVVLIEDKQEAQLLPSGQT